MGEFVSMRVDQLRVGDRIEWPEQHDGVLVVEHLGLAAHGHVEIGCDRWTSDEILPGWERVRMYCERSAAVDVDRVFGGGA